MNEENHLRQEALRRKALEKLNEKAKRGVIGEQPFIHYLARLDRAGLRLTVPHGWYVDNVDPRFPPEPSPWIKVIEVYRYRKEHDPEWYGQVQKEVAQEDRLENIMGTIVCAGTLVLGALFGWWVIRSLLSS
jgi:hypothetical protein